MRRTGAPRDHPRACGEQPAAVVLVFGRWGSSPRVRGAVRLRRTHLRSRGIIPARAGSSSDSRGGGFGSGDHPRASGEQAPHCRQVQRRMGSSPRVRGAVKLCAEFTKTIGIIPARAGSSTGNPACRVRTWDHPRACGEQDLQFIDALPIVGSSPRVRGAALGAHTPNDLLGIIPARAGSSTRPS